MAPNEEASDGKPFPLQEAESLSNTALKAPIETKVPIELEPTSDLGSISLTARDSSAHATSISRNQPTLDQRETEHSEQPSSPSTPTSEIGLASSEQDSRSETNTEVTEPSPYATLLEKIRPILHQQKVESARKQERSQSPNQDEHIGTIALPAWNEWDQFQVAQANDPIQESGNQLYQPNNSQLSQVHLDEQGPEDMSQVTRCSVAGSSLPFDEIGRIEVTAQTKRRRRTRHRFQKEKPLKEQLQRRQLEDDVHSRINPGDYRSMSPPSFLPREEAPVLAATRLSDAEREASIRDLAKAELELEIALKHKAMLQARLDKLDEGISKINAEIANDNQKFTPMMEAYDKKTRKGQVSHLTSLLNNSGEPVKSYLDLGKEPTFLDTLYWENQKLVAEAERVARFDEKEDKGEKGKGKKVLTKRAKERIEA